MNRRVAIWGTLILVHVAIGLLAILLNNDRMGAIAAGSLYGPLAPLDGLGLPVFGNKNGYVPTITFLGWVISILLWFAVYWVLAGVLAWLIGKRARAA
jgi:hypothetical protein